MNQHLFVKTLIAPAAITTVITLNGLILKPTQAAVINLPTVTVSKIDHDLRFIPDGEVPAYYLIEDQASQFSVATFNGSWNAGDIIQGRIQAPLGFLTFPVKSL